MSAIFAAFLHAFIGPFGFSTGLVLPILAVWAIMRSAMK